MSSHSTPCPKGARPLSGSHGSVHGVRLPRVLRKQGDRPVTRLFLRRAFLFAIRDGVSGAVLFLGRVTDPTQRG